MNIEKILNFVLWIFFIWFIIIFILIATIPQIMLDLKELSLFDLIKFLKENNFISHDTF